MSRLNKQIGLLLHHKKSLHVLSETDQNKKMSLVIDSLLTDSKSGSGKRRIPISNDHKKSLNEMIKNKQSINVHDLKMSMAKRKKIINTMNKIINAKSGGNLWNDIKSGWKKLKSKSKQTLQSHASYIKDFFEGKKELQPSQLFTYVAGVSGIAASLSATNPLTLPLAAPLGIIAGLSSGVAAIEGASGRGFNVKPFTKLKAKNWAKKNPEHAELIVKKSESLKKKGGTGFKDDLKKWGPAILGIVGTVAGAAAYGAYVKHKGSQGVKPPQMQHDPDPLSTNPWSRGSVKASREPGTFSAVHGMRNYTTEFIGDGIGYLEKNPEKAVEIMEKIMSMKKGSGIHLAGEGGLSKQMKKLLLGLGITATVAAIGFGAMYYKMSPKGQRDLLNNGMKIVNKLTLDYDNPSAVKAANVRMGRLGLKKAAGIKRIGNKKEVFIGTAQKTSGGLTKADLMKNPRGKVVSKKKYAAGKRAYKNIQKYTFNKRKK